jgi:CheY-like chemotaxis protein
LRPAFQLGSAVQGLFKKLQEKPAHIGTSTLDTADVALQVMGELCVDGVNPRLADAPAINILVVDDEPLARRAMVVALQTAFLKPESADSGEAALALASEKSFDVIFLDVQMPGMDGFQTCSKIRETGLNRGTPVIFVTGHKDFKSRMASARCGGSDFVVKPFLFVELTVKALTFTLRNRLQNHGK